MARERMAAGLSTRNHPAGLEPVGDVDATRTKRSSAARRFVERRCRGRRRVPLLYCLGVKILDDLATSLMALETKRYR